VIKPKVAAIVTECRPNSADVIVGKFLRGLPCDEALYHPRIALARYQPGEAIWRPGSEGPSGAAFAPTDPVRGSGFAR